MKKKIKRLIDIMQKYQRQNSSLQKKKQLTSSRQKGKKNIQSCNLSIYAQFIQCSLALNHLAMISESPQINSKESPSLLLLCLLFLYIYKESVQLKKLEV